MRVNILLMAAIVLLSAVMFSASVIASPSASILYQETDLGNGWWTYDYTFENTSTADYLYSVRLNFDGFYSIFNPEQTSGWKGSWGIISPTVFMETHTINTGSQVAPADSLSGFSFTINSQIGDVPFTAYFDNHSGGRFSLTGNTVLETPPVAPEPLSAILFVVGGLMLGTRFYLKRKKVRIHS
jgi:hypothetical protein